MTPASLAALFEDLEWQTNAACRDLDSSYFFWGEGKHGGGIPDAIRLVALATCQRCEVRQECLDYAVETVQPGGIWGGLTPRQRRRLRREAVA